MSDCLIGIQQGLFPTPCETVCCFNLSLEAVLVCGVWYLIKCNDILV